MKRGTRHGAGDTTGRWLVAGICLALVAATLAVYGQALGFGFVFWDDPSYVTSNAYVRAGITSQGLAWAFGSAHGPNWHPLTELSHMVDVELYGVNPAGHHATSILLHVGNALLLFRILASMTGALWRSALVAALFALHPLHVESVVWISERKDVLSGLFGLLSLAAYVGWTRRRGALRYLTALTLFGLGLMAKPMLVTLPFVFLLIDYWPLQRVDPASARGSDGPTDPTRSGFEALPRRPLAALLLEKAPFLALSIASSVVAVFTQDHAGTMGSAAGIPLDLRVVNAVVSYGGYLSKTIWPAQLAVLYPHPALPGGTPWTTWQVAWSGLLLLAASVLALRLGRRRPYGVMGWLWFVGMLVPVIGLVQVGQQAMADRYTYLPLIGIFVLFAWSLGDFVEARWEPGGHGTRIVAALVCALLVAVLGSAWQQARHWKDSVSLLERAVDVTPRNPMMQNNLAWILATHPRSSVRDGARAVLLMADVSRSPEVRTADTLDTLAAARAEVGQFRPAVRAAREALQLAVATGNTELAAQIRGRIQLYLARRAYRELPSEERTEIP